MSRRRKRPPYVSKLPKMESTTWASLFDPNGVRDWIPRVKVKILPNGMTYWKMPTRRPDAKDD